MPIMIEPIKFMSQSIDNFPFETFHEMPNIQYMEEES